ncbi:MAG TPA: hypothetical protein VE074_04260 [Jatrophihabitantaceae bacterium]|nr:hypothetical protein [Jatrophihabitantaceae bacterium]
MIDELSDDLGVAPEHLAALRRFSEDEQRIVAAAVTRARQAQAADLDDALRRALRFIPRVLRGRASRLLFPDGDRG